MAEVPSEGEDGGGYESEKVGECKGDVGKDVLKLMKSVCRW